MTESHLYICSLNNSQIVIKYLLTVFILGLVSLVLQPVVFEQQRTEELISGKAAVLSVCELQSLTFIEPVLRLRHLLFSNPVLYDASDVFLILVLEQEHPYLSLFL